MKDAQELWAAANNTHQWEQTSEVCKACGRTAKEVVDKQIYQCDQPDSELRQTLGKALKHHGY